MTEAMHRLIASLEAQAKEHEDQGRRLREIAEHLVPAPGLTPEQAKAYGVAQAEAVERIAAVIREQVVLLRGHD